MSDFTTTGIRTVLVTGASGYVGGRLVPRLAEEGYRIRTTTRPKKGGADVDQPWWSDRVETVPMDVLDRESVRDAVRRGRRVLPRARDGRQGLRPDRPPSREPFGGGRRRSRRPPGRLPVGDVPPGPESELSEHIASRLEVERILTGSSATVISLRAAVILGSGSTSFEIIRQVSERLPVQTVPTWMDATVQPIAVVDVVEALVGALTAPTGSRHYDVGGPDRLAYPDLLDRYADVAGIKRPQVMVPFLPTDLVGRLTGAFTEVPTSTVEALVESLHEDMVCAEEDFRRELLPQGYHLLGLDEAIARSLRDPADAPPDRRDPMGPMPQDPTWADGGEHKTVMARAADAVRNLMTRSDH